MSVDTFDEVVRHYTEIRPIVSCVHPKKDDIRPLGQRRRKWERISCVSDREYILYDTLPYRHRSSYSDRALDCPPITWKRKGTRERVTVRGAITSGGDTSRYNFLRTWLPLGLRFDNWTRLGSHYVYVVGKKYRGAVDGKKYYLPRPENRNDDRDYFLTFERRVGYADDWELVSREYNVPRVQVDKKKKAAAKEHIASFYEWLCAIGPVLPVKDWEYHKKLRDEVREYLEDPFERNRLYSSKAYHNGGRVIPPKLALEIMKNYNHPLRIHLACNFLTHQREDFDTAEDAKKFRPAFNRWVNKTLGFNQTIRK